MQVDYSPRAGGKTTRLIFWLRMKENRILLTFSKSEQRRMQHEYEDVAERIVYYMDFIQGRQQGTPMQGKEISIDNADIVLQEIFNRNIIRKISITNNPEDDIGERNSFEVKEFKKFK